MRNLKGTIKKSLRVVLGGERGSKKEVGGRWQVT